MQNNEHGIFCDVCDCCYNEQGKACKKQAITVSCSEKGCTCCKSYQCENDR